MIVNGCVKAVSPHLYTCCSKISTLGMCSHKNMGTRMCILMKKQNGKGTRLCSQLPSPSRLETCMCYKRVFLCFLKTEIRSCFFCSFCQKLFTFRDQKLRKRHAAGNTELSKSHDSCKKYKNAKKDTKDIT